MAGEQKPSLISRLVGWLIELFFGAIRQQGRTEAEREQQEASDALHKKMDEIANDDRDLDDALARLRNKPKVDRRDVP